MSVALEAALARVAEARSEAAAAAEAAGDVGGDPWRELLEVAEEVRERRV